jgi:hypothetical protein
VAATAVVLVVAALMTVAAAVQVLRLTGFGLRLRSLHQ